MYIEIDETYDDTVRKILKREGIPFSDSKSPHEFVVENELTSMWEEITQDCFREWSKLRITESEFERRADILEEIYKGLIAKSHSIVMQDDSFLSVQDTIREKVEIEIAQRT